MYKIRHDRVIKLKEIKTSDKYEDLARELKKQWNKKVTVIPIVIGALGRIGTGTWALGSKRTIGENLNYSIVEIGQNTEKSPGALKRLTVIQTAVKTFTTTRTHSSFFLTQGIP